MLGHSKENADFAKLAPCAVKVVVFKAKISEPIPLAFRKNSFVLLIPAYLHYQCRADLISIVRIDGNILLHRFIVLILTVEQGDTVIIEKILKMMNIYEETHS